jgi:hypothetical protein
MLIQAGRKRLKIVSVPVRTNRTPRPSRLFRSVPQFISNQVVTMARTYATYNPLRAFTLIGGLLTLVGTIPILRFLGYWAAGEGGGHLQSLVLGGVLVVVGVLSGLMGILAELIGANRKLLELSLTKLRQLEHRLASFPAADSSTPAGPHQQGKEAESP